MSRPDQAARRRAIAAELHVSPTFDARDEAERRIGFVADYLRTAGLRACVLGISGGIDSSTAGRLAQLAVERLRASGYDARFVATTQSPRRCCASMTRHATSARCPIRCSTGRATRHERGGRRSPRRLGAAGSAVVSAAAPLRSTIAHARRIAVARRSATHAPPAEPATEPDARGAAAHRAAMRGAPRRPYPRRVGAAPRRLFRHRARRRPRRAKRTEWTEKTK